MNGKIAEIDILQYITGYGPLRTPLSDFYARTRKCRFYGLTDGDGAPAGLLLTEDGAVTEVLFLNAADSDPDVKEKLLRWLTVHIAPGTCVHWRIRENVAEEKLAAACGFKLHSAAKVFRSVRADSEQAAEFFQKYAKLAASAEKSGYRAVRFAELTGEERRQILEDPDHEFAPELHPEVLMADRAGGFSDRLSIAAVSEGKVIAYSVIRELNGKCIFEILCVARSKRRSRAVILPVLRSAQEIVKAGHETLFFTVYDANAEMQAQLRGCFANVIESETVQHNMMFIPGDPRRMRR